MIVFHLRFAANNYKQLINYPRFQKDLISYGGR